MIKVKKKHEVLLMSEAGKRLAEVFVLVPPLVGVGISTFDLDHEIELLMLRVGLKGVCKGYGGYPAVSCISVNDVVVHGIPSKNVVLKDGDFVKIDLVGSFKGYCADMARGFFVTKKNPNAFNLDLAAKEAFDVGFKNVRAGVRLHTVSAAIEQSILKAGYAVVKEFAGHGIGKNIHEDPEIPNYGIPHTGPMLQSGMTLAIEPMLTEVPCSIRVDDDGWTARTSNGCLASHFENTVLVTETGAVILTE